MDGDFNLGGILKGTAEGIRGPELSYLGKSMGVNDTLIPTTTAVLGSIAGAAAGRLPGIRGNKVRTIGSLVGGGLAGLVGGQAAGGALEEAADANVSRSAIPTLTTTATRKRHGNCWTASTA